MRISDWSSDVCSSDLLPLADAAPAARGLRDARGRGLPRPGRDRRTQRRHAGKAWARWLAAVVRTGRLTHCPCRSGFSRELFRRRGERQKLAAEAAPTRAVRRSGLRPRRLLIFEASGAGPRPTGPGGIRRSEEHTSELQSLMRISYAVFR